MLSPDDIEGERNEKEEKGKGEEDEYKEKEEGGIEVRGQKGDEGGLEWIVRVLDRITLAMLTCAIT